MNDSDRKSHLRRIATDAPQINRYFTVPGPDRLTVIGRIDQAAPGIKAARYDTDPVSGHVVSDPTGNAAAAGTDNKATGRNESGVELKAEVDKRIKRVHDDLAFLAQVAGNHPPLRHANEADRLALARINAKADPECESCRRIDSEMVPGQPWFQDAYTKDPTQLPVKEKDGRGTPRLDEAMHLCRWCYRFVCTMWRLPSEKELVRHQKMLPPVVSAEEEKQLPAKIAARKAWWKAQMASIGDQLTAAHAQENAEQRGAA